MRPSGEWQVFAEKPGVTVWGRFNGRRWEVRHQYDVTDQIAANAAERSMQNTHRFGSWRKVASIPAGMAFGTFVGDALHEQDKRATRKWLNDSDNAAFRTFEGRV